MCRYICQYYKCKWGWKTIGRQKGAYKCDNFREIVAHCVSCPSFQVKKRENFFSAKAVIASSQKSFIDQRPFKTCTIRHL